MTIIRSVRKIRSLFYNERYEEKHKEPFKISEAIISVSKRFVPAPLVLNQFLTNIVGGTYAITRFNKLGRTNVEKVQFEQV